MTYEPYTQYDAVELRMPVCDGRTAMFDGRAYQVEYEYWNATVAKVGRDGIVVLATPPGEVVPIYIPIAKDMAALQLRRPRFAQ